MSAYLTERPPDHPDWLGIGVREHGTTTVIELDGEWDLAGLHAARQAMVNAVDRAPECLVLDLSRLVFIDAGGVHATIGLARHAAQQDTRLVIIPGPRGVHRVFELSGVLETLPFIEPQPTAWPAAKPRGGRAEPRQPASSRWSSRPRDSRRGPQPRLRPVGQRPQPAARRDVSHLRSAAGRRDGRC